jgi:hypothetical protein
MQEISFQDRTANHFTAKSGKNAFLAVNWPLSHSLTILSVEPPLCRWHQSLLGFPRDRTKKNPCPVVHLSLDNGKSKNSVTNSSVKNCQKHFFFHFKFLYSFLPSVLRPVP